MVSISQIILEEIILHEAFRWGLWTAVIIYLVINLINYLWRRKKKKP